MSVGLVLPAAVLGLNNLESLLFRPQRGFFKSGSRESILVPHAVLSERHAHRMMISKFPVEQGSTISDHAWMLPKSVTVACIWSNSPPAAGNLFGAAANASALFANQKVRTAVGIATAIPGTVNAVTSLLSGNGPNQAREVFLKLQELQESKVPFDLYTGKGAYRSMLIASLGVETDRQREHCLAVVVECEELLLAQPQSINVPINTQNLGDPAKNSPTTDGGARNLVPGTNFVD